ncbi:LuxR C-terminal-related transcriptional regulator [Noviherbaspirillum galbum]|uniref:Response regulator transcription factor n=1 Tax=Noviherbaspirillum galbum TaxID=2709383 RepID=A0A6B3SVW1_9BURK|nr:response regulator transcription factor [Noviherbaspirillum galbum]NEX64678.1 response regulator transcription factor [Noviherbaspirillum galbum]
MMASLCSPIRIMLVDRHPTILWGLEQLIMSQFPRMEVAGSAVSAVDAVYKARSLQPDLVLLDLELGESNALEIIPQLLNVTGARLLIVTQIRDSMILDEAILQGACGIVCKESSLDVLVQAIDKVCVGQVWLNRAATSRVLQKLRERNGLANTLAKSFDCLTQKEWKVLEAIMGNCGAANRALASRLGISEYTLREHLTSLFRKMGVESRVKLYLYVLEHGLGNRAALSRGSGIGPL